MKSLALLSIILAIVSLPDISYAYLDPGSGSVMLQFILAFFFGTAVTLKICWSKIKTFFKRNTTKEEQDQK